MEKSEDGSLKQLKVGEPDELLIHPHNWVKRCP
jgi:hypothetical protein